MHPAAGCPWASLRAACALTYSSSWFSMPVAGNRWASCRRMAVKMALAPTDGTAAAEPVLCFSWRIPSFSQAPV